MKKPKRIQWNWNDELNSEAFIAGLDKITSLTREHEQEFGFTLDYCPLLKSFVYPEKIVVGNKDRITFHRDYPINLEALCNTYKEEKGLPFAHKSNPEWIKRKSEIPQDEQNREFFEASKWLNEYQKKHPQKGLYLEFPKTTLGGKRDKGHNRVLDKDPFHDDCESRIVVHTHPDGKYPFPSKKDLENFNAVRRESLLDDFIYNVKPSPNHLFVIVGVDCTAKSDYASLIAIQERTEESLPVETDFKQISTVYQMIVPPYAPMNNVFGAKMMNAARSAIKKEYTFINCHYNQDKKIIETYKGDSWSDLI